MNFSFRLRISYFLVGLLPILFLNLFFSRFVSQTLNDIQIKNLDALHKAQKQELNQYLSHLKDHLLVLSENENIAKNLIYLERELKKITSDNAISPEFFKKIQSEVQSLYGSEALASSDSSALLPQTSEAMVLQYYYRVKNPNPETEWHKLDKAEDVSSYSATHKNLHSFLRNIWSRYRLGEILLLNPEGLVVYSLLKGAELGQKLGEQNTDLYGSFQEASGKEKGTFFFSDYSISPTTKKVRAWLSTPVWQENKAIGVLMLELPIQEICLLLSGVKDLLASGNSYLVGPDRLLRTDSILDANQTYEQSFNNPDSMRMNADFIKNALDGKAGHINQTNRQGELLKNAYSRIDVFGKNWAFVSETSPREIENAGSRLNLLTAGLSLATCLFVYFISMATIQNLNAPLRQAMDLAEEVAEGSFEKRLAMKREDEFGQLGKALDSMADNLAVVVSIAESIASGDLSKNIKPSSEKDKLGVALQKMSASLNDLLSHSRLNAMQVVGRAQEIAQASASLSQGATQQASSLEETSSAMHEMDAQAKSNAENALRGLAIGEEVHQASKNGDLHMQSMVKSMQELNQSSQEIARIVKMIEEIAFQTNLLSLNASIEAARAGTHGRGFAVVAGEVRNLSARSGQAAQEINDLINSVVEKVENGTRIAEQAALAQKEILQKVNLSSACISQIANQSQEQAVGIKQIETALAQINQITLQNTASAEELASASEELNHQATSLQEQISVFRLKQEQA